MFLQKGVFVRHIFSIFAVEINLVNYGSNNLQLEDPIQRQNYRPFKGVHSWRNTVLDLCKTKDGNNGNRHYRIMQIAV